MSPSPRSSAGQSRGRSWTPVRREWIPRTPWEPWYPPPIDTLRGLNQVCDRKSVEDEREDERTHVSGKDGAKAGAVGQCLSLADLGQDRLEPGRVGCGLPCIDVRFERLELRQFSAHRPKAGRK